MPKLLSEELDRRLRSNCSSAHTKNSARGFVDYVVMAEWQADAYMIGRAVAKDSVLMVTSLFHRREMLRRMLIDPNSESTYVVCERHEFEQKSYGIPIKSGCKSWSQSYKLTLPKDVGPKSTQNISDNSSGLGSDRQLQRVLLESREIIQRGWVVSDSDPQPRNTNARVARAPSLTAELRAVEAERDFYKLKAQQHHADAVSATLALNQTLEQSCPNQHVKMNARVRNLASLDTRIFETQS
jgi:hypothetical protein